MDISTSKRFLLTVHTLTQTKLKFLDTLTDKAIQWWSGIPRSATNVLIHSKEGMNIKSISQLYTECHTVSHVRTRLQGDATVNNAVNCTLNREGSCTSKKSTTVECEATFLHSMQINSVNGEVPQFTGDQATSLTRKFNNNVKSSVKKRLDKQHKERCDDKLNSLAVQGRNLELAASASTDFIWKSFLYDMKAGTMKFC